jgi:hypothetical protein
MNAYPVRLAAGLALIALCAFADESPNAKMAEPQAKPATTQKTLPDDVGLNVLPVQLPAQTVDELRNHIDRLNRDLQEAFQRQQRPASHTLYHKALTNHTEIETFVQWEESSHRPMALPVLRSSW